MAASGKRALGCLGLIVMFFVTWMGIYTYLKSEFADLQKKRESESAKTGPNNESPIIATVPAPAAPADKKKSRKALSPAEPQCFVVQYIDWQDFQKAFPDFSLKFPSDRDLTAQLKPWPARTNGFAVKPTYTVRDLPDGQQRVDVTLIVTPPPDADPEVTTETHRFAYRTDGKQFFTEVQSSARADRNMQTMNLALTFNMGLWVVLLVVWSVVKLARRAAAG